MLWATRKLFRHAFLAMTLCSCSPALEFINATDFDGFEGGIGFRLGYDFKETDAWQVGGQLHYFRGWTNEEDVQVEGDMTFEARSLSLFVHPKIVPFTFKAGFIHARYSWTPYSFYGTGARRASGLGIAYGIGFAIHWKKLHFPIIDLDHYEIGGHGFNSLAISVLIFH